MPLEDLVSFDDLVPQPQPLEEQNANIHLGFVETFVPPVDTAQFLHPSSKGRSAAAVRCWANHFSPLDRTKPTVTIPTEWMDFFSLLLLKLGSFEWAKDFLTSLAWIALTNLSNGNTYSFSLPKSSPSVVISDYSYTEPPLPYCVDIDEEEKEEEENDPEKNFNDKGPVIQDEENRLLGKQPMPTNLNLQEVMTPPPSAIPLAPATRKHGKQPIISDATLRRSERLHKNSKGFKSPTCKNKNCLGCSSNPPTLSSSVVRDLGPAFCNLDPISLSEDKLNAKVPKKKFVVKPAKKAKKSQNVDVSEGTSGEKDDPEDKAASSKKKKDEGSSKSKK